MIEATFGSRAPRWTAPAGPAMIAPSEFFCPLKLRQNNIGERGSCHARGWPQSPACCHE